MDIFLGYFGIIIIIIIILLINKHILGLSGYGFFYPLIIAIVIANPYITNDRTIIIIISTLLGWISQYVIIKKIHLLVYPKYAIYTTISLFYFIILSLSYLLLGKEKALSHDAIYMIVSSFIIMTTIMPKIYNISKGLLSRQRRKNTIGFWILTLIITYIFQSESLLYFFSQRVLISFSLIGVIILLSGYTGLQIKEIIRFRKLILQKIIAKKTRS